MLTISYGAQKITTTNDETVLQALTRQGVIARSSCRGGTCQTCVLRCLEGEIPARAQRGLSDKLLSKSYFMPCVCHPLSDMVIAAPLADDFFVAAQLDQRHIDKQGLLFLFEPPGGLAATVKTVMVRDAAGHQARFALANQPDQDYYFGIYLAANDLSALAVYWRTNLQVGDTIEMREALPDELSSNAIQHAPCNDTPAERPKDPPPDLELWAALGHGTLLTLILTDFYARVYRDAQMLPFFSGFTQQRLIEKQYSFMQQAMTGNKVFFGNRPRNSHHWMVISDALFEHREQLMLAAMRAHGLAEQWIDRWLALENYYRPDIVKATAFPLQINGVDLPLEGYEELAIEVGAMCDGCGGVIEAGETVRYHVRRGTIYCRRCGATDDNTK